MAKKTTKRKGRSRKAGKKPTTRKKAKKDAGSTVPLDPIAHHEAGHTVADLALGLFFKGVTIERRGGVLGSLREYSPRYQRSTIKDEEELRDLAEKAIISCYAGYESEREFDPYATDKYSLNDFAQARKLMLDFKVVPKGASFLGDDVCDEYLEELRGEAAMLIKRHWTAVKKLAQALLRRKTMTADEARKCVQKYLRDADE